MSAPRTEHTQSVDPATGEVIANHAIASDGDLDAALTRAYDAQRRWRTTSFDERASFLLAVADALTANRDAAADLITAEMGKTRTEARAEIDKSASACQYYAEHGAQQLAPETIDIGRGACHVQFPPLGVVLAVMPWNYPIWQVVRAFAPTVMAGNTMVLKHASNVTGSALLLHRLVAELTPSILETVVVSASRVDGIIADHRIAAVTLTGSEAVGQSIARACATALKPSVLELGGSDPFIVLGDADVDRAAAEAVKARFVNAGQSCVAGKRFIVVEAVADAFQEAFVQRTGALRVGDPTADSTDLGPMARTGLRDELADQVRRGIAEGGHVLTGAAEAPAGPGAFFTPTVVSVGADNVLTREETFGPAAALIRVPDADEAIRVANDTTFGLSSSLWTADVDHGLALSDRIEAGAVFINAMTASDPRVPFGGIKRSGWGRELGPYGIREFVNVQAVTVAG